MTADELLGPEPEAAGDSGMKPVTADDLLGPEIPTSPQAIRRAVLDNTMDEPTAMGLLNDYTKKAAENEPTSAEQATALSAAAGKSAGTFAAGVGGAKLAMIAAAPLAAWSSAIGPVGPIAVEGVAAGAGFLGGSMLAGKAIDKGLGFAGASEDIAKAQEKALLATAIGEELPSIAGAGITAKSLLKAVSGKSGVEAAKLVGKKAAVAGSMGAAMELERPAVQQILTGQHDPLTMQSLLENVKVGMLFAGQDSGGYKKMVSKQHANAEAAVKALTEHSLSLDQKIADAGKANNVEEATRLGQEKVRVDGQKNLHEANLDYWAKAKTGEISEEQVRKEIEDYQAREKATRDAIKAKAKQEAGRATGEGPQWKSMSVAGLDINENPEGAYDVSRKGTKLVSVVHLTPDEAKVHPFFTEGQSKLSTGSGIPALISPDGKTIYLVRGHGDNGPKFTHEVIHALDMAGLITSEQRKAIIKKYLTPDMKAYIMRHYVSTPERPGLYPDIDKAVEIEGLSQIWENWENNPHLAPKAAWWEHIRDFVRAIWGAKPTASKMARNIMAGKFAEPGEVKTGQKLSITPHDLEPALMVNGKPEFGEDTHSDILSRLIKTNPGKGGEYLTASNKDENHVFRNTKTGEILSRDLASKELGLTESLSSQKLMELQGINPSLVGVIKDNPMGFTMDTESGKMEEHGFAVAPSKLTEHRLAPAELNSRTLDSYIATFENVLREHPNAKLGGWLDKKTNQYVLDIVFLIDNKSDALYIARHGKQDAIFHLDNLEEIRTGEGIRALQSSGAWRDEGRGVLHRFQEQVDRAIQESGGLERGRQQQPRLSAKEPDFEDLQWWRNPEYKGAVRAGQSKLRTLQGNPRELIPGERAGKIKLSHWSHKILSAVDPSFYGKGYAGDEKTRRIYSKHWLNRSYYGIGEYQPEQGLGPNRHEAVLDAKKLYDIQNDPDNLGEKIGRISDKAYPNAGKDGTPGRRAADTTILEKLIKSAGYSGYFSHDHQVAAVFDKLPVKQARLSIEPGKDKQYLDKQFREVMGRAIPEPVPHPAAGNYKDAFQGLYRLISNPEPFKANGMTINFKTPDPTTARKLGMRDDDVRARAVHALTDAPERNKPNPDKVRLAPMTENTIRQADFVMRMERDMRGDAPLGRHDGVGFVKLYDVDGKKVWHLAETDDRGNFITQYSWDADKEPSGRVMKSKIKMTGSRLVALKDSPGVAPGKPGLPLARTTEWPTASEKPNIGDSPSQEVKLSISTPEDNPSDPNFKDLRLKKMIQEATGLKATGQKKTVANKAYNMGAAQAGASANEKITKLAEAMKEMTLNSVAYKEVLKSAEKAGITGRQAARKELEVVDNWMAATQRDATKTLIDFVKEALPKPEQAAFLNRIFTATARTKITRSQDMEAFAKRIATVTEAISQRAQEVHRKTLIDTIVQTVEKVMKSKGVAVKYKNIIQAMLEDVGIKPMSDIRRAQLQETKAYVDRMNAAGKPHGLPDSILESLEALNHTNLRDMPTSVLQAMIDRIGLAEQLGRQLVGLRENQREREREAFASDMANSGATPLERRPVFRAGAGKGLKPAQVLGNAWNKLLDLGAYVDRATQPIDSLFDYLENGGGRYDGWLNRVLRGQTDLDYNRAGQMRDGWTKAVLDLSKKHNMTDKQGERIFVYGAVKMEGGRERLKEMGETDASIDHIIQTITPLEKSVLEAARPAFNESFEMTRKLMDELYNVELTPIDHYLPFQRDYELYKKTPSEMADSSGIFNRKGEDISNTPELAGYLEGGMAQTFSRKTTQTKKGFTVERQENAKTPIRLNFFDVFTRHISDVAHFVATQRNLKTFGEIARSKEFAAKYGELGQKIVTDWLDTFARRGGASQHQRIQVLDVLRRNTSRGIIAFRPLSNLKHLSNIFFAIQRTGIPWFHRGMTEAWTPKGREFIQNNFNEIYNRSGGSEPSQSEALTGKLGRFAKYGFIIERTIDQTNASSTALGVYMRLLAEKGLDPSKYAELPIDRDAQIKALTLSRRAMASPLPKDVPQMLSRGAITGGNISLGRSMTQFQNIMLDQWSNIRHDLWRAGIREKNPALAAQMILTVLAVLSAEMGIVHSVKSATSAALGEKKKEKKSGVAHTMSLELLRRFPLVGSSISGMIEYGPSMGQSSGIPIVDTATGLKKNVAGVITAKNPDTKVSQAIQAVGTVGTLAGVPGASVAGEFGSRYYRAKK